MAAETERVNEWVAARVRSGEVALTQREASDARYFYLVRVYANGGPELDYRFLPPDGSAADYVREHGLRVAWFIAAGPEDVTAQLRSLGLPGYAMRVPAAPGVVYRVSASPP